MGEGRSRQGGDGSVESFLEVPRTARYLTRGPADADEVWIVLHGYGQLATRFLRRFSAIDDDTRLIVAPEGLSRFYVGSEPGRHGPGSLVGASWMTREARASEVRDYVRYLDLLAAHITVNSGVGEAGTPSHVVVLGFSQGVATAARWTTAGQIRPDRLILWGDYLPPDLDVSGARRRWSALELVLVRGAQDRAVANPEMEANERRMLDEIGTPVRSVAYEGGHDIDADTLAALAREGASEP